MKLAISSIGAQRIKRRKGPMHRITPLRITIVLPRQNREDCQSWCCFLMQKERYFLPSTISQILFPLLTSIIKNKQNKYDSWYQSVPNLNWDTWRKHHFWDQNFGIFLFFFLNVSRVQIFYKFCARVQNKSTAAAVKWKGAFPNSTLY